MYSKLTVQKKNGWTEFFLSQVVRFTRKFILSVFSVKRAGGNKKIITS